MKSTTLFLAALYSVLVTAQSPTPLTNDPKWAYSGCYTAPPGHILDGFTKQNLSSAVDITTCLAKCGTRFAALGAGVCYCTPLIPTTLTSPPTSLSNCTFPCSLSSSQACGGPLSPLTLFPSALSLYDSAPPAPITYPEWMYVGCVGRLSELKEANINLTHVATRGVVDVEGCLRGCDTSGLGAVIAGLSGGLCYCAPSLGDLTPVIVGNAICSFECLGNPLESCGGPFLDADPAISLYTRPSGPADPKITAGIFTGTGVLVTRTTTVSQVGATGSKGGGAVATAKGSGTRTGSAGVGGATGKSGAVGLNAGSGGLFGAVFVVGGFVVGL